MKAYKVAIIGGGIVGACMFSQLARSGVSCVLLEADCDVAVGATKANSGIVHSGYDCEPGSYMAQFNVRGNEMFPGMCKRLGVKFFKCGTLTVADRTGLSELERLKRRGETNGVTHLQVLNRDDILEIEPNIADHIEYALLASTGGYVSPYLLCIALAEEGVVNGGEVKLNFCVNTISYENGKYILSASDKSVQADYVVNCAGINATKINSMLNDTKFTYNLIKGEYMLLSRDTHDFVKRPIFPLPSDRGKGVLCTPTEHNLMFGPTARCTMIDDTAIDYPNLGYIKEHVLQTIKAPPFNKAIKLFAGVRVKSGFDFVVERSYKNPKYYYAIGICSPGLTSAPAIAECLVKFMQEDGLKLEHIQAVKRKVPVVFSSLNEKQQKALVKQNPAYAKIVCRCENISEGEIIDALRSPIVPTSVDGIKRRVRATMGQCQGGFCMPHILKLMERELKIPINNITQKGTGSEIILDEIKHGGIYDE